MNNIQQQKGSSVPQLVYKPSEIIGIFNTYLAKQAVNAQLVYIRGVYLANGRQSYNGYYYDTIRDEDRQEELTIYLSQQQRDNLKNGNLVNVGGIIQRNVSPKGQIQINLHVSRIDIVQEQAVDEMEVKRMELRQTKATIGFKNVDGILEQLLYIDQRPKVALLFAQSSITMSDFNAGINAAKTAIDFAEYRVSFSNAQALASSLKSLDLQHFNVIAIIRGGGSGIEKLDDVEVLEVIAKMSTPMICAIGHVEERLFIKQLADKCAPTPNGLGQYFSEMVEMVSEKKTKSRAAITEQIKKQFKDQIEAGKKQNEELQKKLSALTKNQEEATKRHNEQVLAAQKQNALLQNQLKNIQKVHEEQLAKLNETQKVQQENQRKQSDELTKNLNLMQQSNGQLQRNLQAITVQNNESQKKLMEAVEQKKELERQLSEAKANKGNNMWMVIAVIAIAVSIVLVMILINK